MTRTEAIESMENGNKVTHRLFTQEEWMKITGNKYEFEDGCFCRFDEFWLYREDESWQDCWSIFS